MNEKDQFLNEFERKDQFSELLEAPLNSDGEKPKEKDEEDDDAADSVKNRRHRRLEAKLEAERRANIELAAKLEANTEAMKFLKGTEPVEYLAGIERIYGTDSPEASAATELLKKALMNVKETATKEALEIFRTEQIAAKQAVDDEMNNLDSMVEEIEDTYGVEMTPEVQKGFFKALEKVSPKDREGNITHYADHLAVWEDFQSRITKRTENRAKDIGSRSMVQGVATEAKTADEATQRFLRENGLI